MSRTACIWTLDLRLQMVGRDRRERLLAVVDGDGQQARIVAVSMVARNAGVAVGMLAAAAKARCPGLYCGVVEEADLQARHKVLREKMQRLSPMVMDVGAPGCFLLELDGLERVYPSMTAWAQAARELLAELGLQAAVCIGWRRLAVQAVAQADTLTGRLQVRVLPTAAAELALVQSLPVATLTLLLGDAALILQEELGVKTVGEAGKLARNCLVRRLGESGRMLAALATGDDEAWRGRQHLAREEPQASRSLAEPADSWPWLLPMVEELLGELLQEVCGQRRLATGLRLVVRTENEATATVSVKAGEPTTAIAILSELLRLRTASTPLPGPVVEFDLQVATCAPERLQDELFALAPGWEAGRVREVLANLTASLGEGRVGRLSGEASAKPEGAAEIVPLGNIGRAQPRPASKRLVRRLMTPAGKVSRPENLLPGGWTVTGGWWEDAWHRRYRWCRQADGSLAWVYEENQQWFFQGGL